MPAAPPHFPNLLTTFRAKLGCSQEQLAYQFGISFATVNRWENGRTLPSKLAMVQLEGFCALKVKEGRLDKNLWIEGEVIDG